jgi:hypothetical protein
MTHANDDIERLGSEEYKSRLQTANIHSSPHQTGDEVIRKSIRQYDCEDNPCVPRRLW